MTANAGKKLQLLGGLNALGDHLHAQAASDLDQRFGDGRIALVMRDVPEERTVDLEQVDRQVLEPCHRRITGAEIIDGDNHTQRPQGIEGRHRFGFVDQRAFGDLDDEVVRAATGSGEASGDEIDEAFDLQREGGRD